LTDHTQNYPHWISLHFTLSSLDTTSLLSILIGHFFLSSLDNTSFHTSSYRIAFLHPFPPNLIGDIGCKPLKQQQYKHKSGTMSILHGTERASCPRKARGTTVQTVKPSATNYKDLIDIGREELRNLKITFKRNTNNTRC